MADPTTGGRSGELERTAEGAVAELCREVRRQRCELLGYQKAYSLLLGHWGELCRSRDALKHEVRRLEGKADE